MISLSRKGLLAAVFIFAAACGTPGHDSKPLASSTRTGVVGDTALATPTTGTASEQRVQHADSPQAVPASTARRVVVAGVDLTNVGYNKGSPTAPVVVVDLSDFGCPYCGQFARETYPTLDKEYVQTGKVFFKYVPIVMGVFPNGKEAARAAECAGDQRKFWPMHERLYATQNEWKRNSAPFALYQQYAAAIGLDRARFASCYNGQDTHPRTKLATDAAKLLGVRATPSFLVNGRPIEGVLPIEEFRKVLNDAAGEAANEAAKEATK